ncbi:uncharacterized protein LOC131848089 [Achroia grisella]|uniref:uncharacterized protein LOC131848089 n=1 Tax=Achroia grisella TaxID=688607 RepID=UPI0027D33E1E|nr:uncharacterized protein LOC131848089 [Achroia grisella]
MPTTRSQAPGAEKKTTRENEQTEAAPSETTQMSASAAPSSAPQAQAARAAFTSDSAPAPPSQPPTTDVRPARAASVRSRRSTASGIAKLKRLEYEAALQMAKLQADLIRKKLAADVAAVHEETDRDSVCSEEGAGLQRITDWFQRTEKEPTERQASPPRTPKQRRRSPAPEAGMQEGFTRLAKAIERAVDERADRVAPRQAQDLPTFSGEASEWLAFKAAVDQSTKTYRITPAENLARLRACLRGKARETVAALLVSATEPSQIMRTLEQRYGRAEAIIDRALKDLRRMPVIGTSTTEVIDFAIKLQNITTIVADIDRGARFLHNPALESEVSEKLTPHLQVHWCHYAEKNKEDTRPTIIKMAEFLMSEADLMTRHLRIASPTRRTSALPTKQPTKQPTRQPIPKATMSAPRRQMTDRGAAVYAAVEKSEQSTECLCCGAAHVTPKCKKLNDMSLSDRWEWAKTNKMCFQYMNSTHRRFKCKARKCGVRECRKPHHALLHPPEEPPKRQEDTAITAAARLPENSQVLLKVCPIIVKGKTGREVETYAMLDEGSTVTLIDAEIAEQIGAEGPTRSLRIQGAASSWHEASSRVADVIIRGRHHTDEEHSVRARTIRDLTLGTQRVNSEILAYGHLRQLTCEQVCYEDARPKVLIGSDNWHLIVTRKLLIGRHNQPAASLTRLGWVIHGTVPRSVVEDEEHVLHVRLTQRNAEPDMRHIEGIIKAHYDIDALGISSKRLPIAKEERAVATFNRTATRVDGRYVVGLPWERDKFALPPSYDMAASRLRGIERRMDRSTEFRLAYTAEINKLLDKGYAEKVTDDRFNNDRAWYLPHFGVTNPNKPGKLRLVFDAAARSKGMCLNDVLLDGPDMLRSLNGVLYRFREKPVAITADIREMFLQIKIREEDRAAQQFLWRGDDRINPPQKYVMTSMIFGARSTPFIAHSVRDRNAAEHRESHPSAYTAITRNHYMDDWVDSFDSEEEAARAIREVVEVHGGIGFTLAGWNTNRPSLLENVSEDQRARTPKELGANAHPYGKTLRLLWMSAEDQLAFNTGMPRVPREVKHGTRIPTKREALGAVMSLFDPLGLLSPYTITAKIILQALWVQKVEWDDSLPAEEARMFQEWRDDLAYIEELRLPRWYGTNDSQRSQLHVFTDASEQAYATAAYWRTERGDRSVDAVLVAAKARVAPMKAQSIPRMELQASLVGPRLAADVLKGRRRAAEVFLWTVSKKTLHWTRNDTARYNPHAARRMAESAEHTEPTQWRWVPTAHDVTNDATRARYTIRTAADRSVGPALVYAPEKERPKESKPVPAETVARARAKAKPVMDRMRFSSYDRVRRTPAQVLLLAEEYRRRAWKLGRERPAEAGKWVKWRCGERGRTDGRTRGNFSKVDPKAGPP